MTDTDNQFSVYLPDLKPEQIPLHILARFASFFEKAVLSERTKAERPTDGEPLVSLVGIVPGSTAYPLQTASAAVPAVSRILNAIAAPELHWERLRPATRLALEKAFDAMAASGSEVRVTGPLLGGRSATYRRYAPRDRATQVKGDTELSVRVLSVYGKKNARKALVQPLAGGPSFEAAVTNDRLLREVGSKIKLLVILEGEAVWELPEWTVRGFTARHVLPYPDKPFTEGLAEIAAMIPAEEMTGAFERFMAERAAEAEVR
jgi:hypothetical protein